MAWTRRSSDTRGIHNWFIIHRVGTETLHLYGNNPTWVYFETYSAPRYRATLLPVNPRVTFQSHLLRPLHVFGFPRYYGQHDMPRHIVSGSSINPRAAPRTASRTQVALKHHNIHATYRTMTGTVIITGANGSLGTAFVQHFLATYPEHTLICTVRSAARDDENTTSLKNLISNHPASRVHIEQLDLGSLSSVRAFTDRISEQVSTGKIPRITAIVCNAFSWALNGLKFTDDGMETSFQVSHLSHYLLVLRLLGSMDTETGRIVMLGAESHDPDRANPLSKLLARFPDDVEELVNPEADKPAEVHDRGFQRYGTSKLANVIFMQDLNKRLQAVRNPLHVYQARIPNTDYATGPNPIQDNSNSHGPRRPRRLPRARRATPHRPARLRRRKPAHAGPAAHHHRNAHQGRRRARSSGGERRARLPMETRILRGEEARYGSGCE